MALTWNWNELSHSDEYRGQWVALVNCRYDLSTGKPLEGDVVDYDPDFSVLRERMRSSGRCSCAILFCDENMLLERH